jgi:hypothetical protein
MTVKDLRKRLEFAPDDAPVLTPSSDHSYRSARGNFTMAEYDSHDEEYFEYFGDNHMEPGNISVEVFVIE